MKRWFFSILLIIVVVFVIDIVTLDGLKKGLDSIMLFSSTIFL